MTPEQLSLDLSLPSPSFEQLVATLAPGVVDIELSRRLKRGWYVTGRKGLSRRTLTIPAYMTDAPAEVKTALIEWSLLPFRTRRGSTQSQKKRRLEDEVRTYIGSTLPPVHGRHRVDPALLDAPAPGIEFDLREVFDSINTRFFDGRLRSIVRWGAPGSITSSQTHRIGHDGERVSVITIAGAYDDSRVPLFALEAVMYHEMLHLVYPPQRINGRLSIHGREFRAAEAQFPSFKQWRAWERSCLRSISRSIKRKSPRRR